MANQCPLATRIPAVSSETQQFVTQRLQYINSLILCSYRHARRASNTTLEHSLPQRKLYIRQFAVTLQLLTRRPLRSQSSDSISKLATAAWKHVNSLLNACNTLIRRPLRPRRALIRPSNALYKSHFLQFTSYTLPSNFMRSLALPLA